jgi:hypothetical protein
MQKPTDGVFIVVFCVEHISVLLIGRQIYSFDVCVILMQKKNFIFGDKTVLNAVFAFARNL